MLIEDDSMTICVIRVSLLNLLICVQMIIFASHFFLHHHVHCLYCLVVSFHFCVALFRELYVFMIFFTIQSVDLS